MSRKPQDLLEFLRRTSREPDEPAADEPQLEPTTRMLVLRRSQVLVVAGIAAVGLLLAFVLGLGMGSGGDAEAGAAGNVGVWVIQLADYQDTERGRQSMKWLLSDLERMQLGDEVSYRHDRSKGTLFVTVGAWLKDPHGRREPEALLKKVQTIPARNRAEPPFREAKFKYITR